MLCVVLFAIECIAGFLLLDIEATDNQLLLIICLRQHYLLLAQALDETNCIFEHFVFFIFGNVLL
jgi:hypothetical protein